MDNLLRNCKIFTVIVFKLSLIRHTILYHVKCFSNQRITMVRTKRIEVHSDSKTTRNGQPTPKKYSTDDQLEVERRLLKLLMAFCVGHLILSVVTATSLGVYVMRIWPHASNDCRKNCQTNRCLLSSVYKMLSR